MWLIDVETLQLDYVIEMDPEIHKYAILSHAWGPEEVSFAEMTARMPGTEIKKSGFEKVKRCCEQAKADAYKYAWVDTCCIDKTSSAELSESINSMFKWYQQAQVCYVILSDVPAATAFSEPEQSFVKSRWFTRGWTLQELIAPKRVQFFSADWTLIGTKLSLISRVAQITKIDEKILTGEDELESVPIARRMSWAAKRNTTRTEDIAYCLLGIFDISMPMLYGEGKKAFIRLQDEIMKSSQDHTIFAWTDPTAADSENRGLLAPHPRCFEQSTDFVPYFGMTNPGVLKLDVSNLGITMTVAHGTDDQNRRVAYLYCNKNNALDSFAMIYLNPAGQGFTARTRVAHLGMSYLDSKTGSLTIRQNPKPPKKKALSTQYFSVTVGYFEDCDIEKIWIPERTMITHAGETTGTTDAHRKSRFIPMTEFGELSSYGYSILGPGTAVLVLQLKARTDIYLHKIHYGMWVAIGVLHDGRLGAQLVDRKDFYSHRWTHAGVSFEGVSCPGQSSCTTRENGDGWTLELSELSATECKFGDRGINIVLRHR